MTNSTAGGPAILNGGQQQFFTRNSNIDSWSNGVWNQVFLGDNGAPATRLRVGDQPVHQRAQRAGVGGGAVPVHRCQRRGPRVRAGRAARLGRTRLRGGQRAGLLHLRSGSSSSPTRARRCWSINAALAAGQNLILTPGVYDLPRRSWSPPEHDRARASASPRYPSDGDVTMRPPTCPGSSSRA